MEIEGFLRSTASLIAALATFVAAIAALVKAISDFRRQRAAKPRGAKAEGKKPSQPSVLTILAKKMSFNIGVLLVLLSVGILGARALLPPLPLNVQLTSAAWDALNKMDYTTAVAKAQECIETFEGQAIREQEALIANGSPPPPTGAVSDDEKRLVLSRGALNDVATCYFI